VHRGNEVAGAGVSVRDTVSVGEVRREKRRREIGSMISTEKEEREVSS
jgi:hypothetical protein